MKPDEKLNITNYITEMQKIIRTYLNRMIKKKLENLGDMDKFLDI